MGALGFTAYTSASIYVSNSSVTSLLGSSVKSETTTIAIRAKINPGSNSYTAKIPPSCLTKKIPDDNRHSAYEHAGKSTLLIGTTPIQAKSIMDRNCSEARPGVRDNLEDRGVLVECNDDAENKNDHRGHARHEHGLSLGGILVGMRSLYRDSAKSRSLR